MSKVTIVKILVEVIEAEGTRFLRPDDPEAVIKDMLSDDLEVEVRTEVRTANVANGENQTCYPLTNGNFENGTASWATESNHGLLSSIQYFHTGFRCLRATVIQASATS